MSFDLAVVGGGPVGAAIARGLGQARVALVGRPPAAPDPAAGLDSRIYALSPANWTLVEQLAGWGERMARLCPVRAMRVFGDRRSAIEFDAYRAGVPELAWIAEDRVLQDALWSGLADQPSIEVHGSRCRSLQVTDGGCRLELEDGALLQASLVVGADGADSFVREAAGIGVRASAYGQTAVVANFAAEKPHRETACQWFDQGSVLALLPLPEGRVSMVWSLPETRARQVLELAPDEVCRAVEEASHGVAGQLAMVTPCRGFPLRRLSAERMVAPRIALAGDAAHVVHPLAGQGLNLGLQDARELLHALATREPFRGWGDLRLLRRYERARAEAVLGASAAMHGLFTLFGAPGEGWARLRNDGLNLVDRLPVLKNLLMRHAMS